jgi:hypothetical protein
MTVEELLPRLECVRRSGMGWSARCPAHRDRSPSLSIGESGGRVLLHCFAGCTTEAVCDALKMRMADLFAKPGTSCKPEPPVVRAVERQIAGLRSRLTPRERVLPVTIVTFTGPDNLDAAIARGLALAVEGEIVQVVECAK